MFELVGFLMAIKNRFWLPADFLPKSKFSLCTYLQADLQLSLKVKSCQNSKYNLRA